MDQLSNGDRVCTSISYEHRAVDVNDNNGGNGKVIGNNDMDDTEFVTIHHPCGIVNNNNDSGDSGFALPTNTSNYTSIVNNHNNKSNRESTIDGSSSSSSSSSDNMNIIDNDIVAHYLSVHQTISLHLSDKESLSKNLKNITNTDLVSLTATKVSDDDCHLISLPDLYSRLSSSFTTGLIKIDENKKRKKNILSPPNQQHWIVRILLLFVGGFNSLLLVIGVLDVLSWEPLGDDPGPPNPVNWYVGVLLFIVVVLSVMFNAYQLRKTSSIMKSFQNMIPPMAKVKRNGIWNNMLAAELQIGDVVEVSMGQKVPADIRIVETNDLKVDNSMLTGESDPISSSTKCTHRNILETRNMIFFGSMCTEGNGMGIVVNIGDDTIMGKISQLTSSSKPAKTSLQKEIDRFVSIIIVLIFITGFGGIIAWAAWVRVQYPYYLTWQLLIANMGAFVVGYTPEGLPMAVTMTLTVVAKRMAKHNVLVKDLSTIETFNTISLIASGTLTLNKMSVNNIIWGLNELQRAAESHVSNEDSVEPDSSNEMSHLFHCAALCSGVTISNTHSTVDLRPANTDTVNVKLNIINEEDPTSKSESGNTVSSPMSTSSEAIAVGDASDLAVYHWCNRKINVLQYRSEYPSVAMLPFNSRNKYMITVHHTHLHHDDDQLVLLLKGAPEIVLSRCSSTLKHGHHTDSNDSNNTEPIDIKQWQGKQEELGKKGERVLGFAMHYLDKSMYPLNYKFNFGSGDSECNYPTNGFTFLGLISLIDPPRPEVPGALARCKSAHIRVAMVTGDHPSTAVAIGRQIGLLTSENEDSFDIKQDGLGRPSIVVFTNGVQVGVRSPTVTVSKSESEITKDDDKSEAIGVFTSLNDIALGSEYESGTMNERLPRSLIVTGSQIPFVDRQLWKWIFRHDEIVFARTSPEQKLLIVTEAQRLGDKVAVTGDGVNDAPALKKADLGIAMQSGSEVAREAGRIILMDNNFNSIVEGIALGRAVFDNLKKVIMYLLPAGTWSEMLTVMFTIFFGIQSMLSSFLMVVICLLTDVFVSVALVNETAEEDIMTRLPRKDDEHLVDARLIITAYMTTGNFMFFASTISFFWYCSDNGLPFWGVFWAWQWGDGWYGIDGNTLTEIVNTGQSIFFVNLVIMQFGNCLAVRTRRMSIVQHNPLWGPHQNLSLLVGISLALSTLLLVTEASFFQTYFLTRHVPAKFAGIAVCWAVWLIIWDEGRKYIVRNYPKSIVAKYAW